MCASLGKYQIMFVILFTYYSTNSIILAIDTLS